MSEGELLTGDGIFCAGSVLAALIDFDLAHPTTRLYDIANAL